MLNTLDVQLTTADRRRCALAVALYCKHLDSLAKEAENLGKSEDATRHTDEATALRAAIVEPSEEGKDFDLYAGQRLAVEKGLEMLVKNMKAAKGTVKPLGYEDWVGELEGAAAAIEGSLLPQFREQSELALVRPELSDDGAQELKAAVETGE